MSLKSKAFQAFKMAAAAGSAFTAIASTSVTADAQQYYDRGASPRQQMQQANDYQNWRASRGHGNRIRNRDMRYAQPPVLDNGQPASPYTGRIVAYGPVMPACDDSGRVTNYQLLDMINANGERQIIRQPRSEPVGFGARKDPLRCGILNGAIAIEEGKLAASPNRYLNGVRHLR